MTAASSVAAPPDRLTARTDRGVLTLRPVDLAADLPLVHGWMHRRHVVEFWRQDWPATRLHDDLADQLTGTVSRPCLGLLDAVAVSYWEIYRPAADPLGEAYPAQPGDLGVHLLLGEVEQTGRGLGSTLLAAVTDGLFAADPACRRIVAEPDVANIASVRAFQRAGFVDRGRIELADKTATLLVAERER